MNAMRFPNRLLDPAYDTTLDDPDDEMFDAARAAHRARPVRDWLTGPFRSLDTFWRRAEWSSPGEAVEPTMHESVDWQRCDRDVSPLYVRALRWLVPDARVSVSEVMPAPSRDRSSRTS